MREFGQKPIFPDSRFERGGRDIKCPKCGAENPDDAMFCGTCGWKMDQEFIAPPEQNAPESVPPPRVQRARRTWKWGVAVIILLLVVASLFLVSALTPIPSIVPVLDAFYDYGNTTVTSSIQVRGLVFNNGTKTAGCWLNFTLKDSRGWSSNDSMNLGLIPTGGGFVVVDKTYSWPMVYNGISLVSPTPIVPKWSYSITTY